MADEGQCFVGGRVGREGGGGRGESRLGGVLELVFVLVLVVVVVVVLSLASLAVLSLLSAAARCCSSWSGVSALWSFCLARRPLAAFGPLTPAICPQVHGLE